MGKFCENGCLAFVCILTRARSLLSSSYQLFLLTANKVVAAEYNDWVILRDGLVVGRVMHDQQQSSSPSIPQWAWLVMTMPSKNGWSDSMEAALEEVYPRASDKRGHTPHGRPDDR